MADEQKEQLRISAELDTSKLKQDAQQGMQSVVNEEKKVENQSKQTSKAIDDIGKKGKDVGNALQQAGNQASKAIDSVTQAGKNAGQALQQSSNQGTEALKKVGNEADKTAKKIAGIDTSVKNIKLGQAIGLAGQFITSDTGKALGGYVGSQLGMSESAQGLAGSAIQGGLSGAATGAMLAGPMGAAVGGLIGAGTALITAGRELQKAADSQLKNLESTKDRVIAERKERIFDNKVENLGETDLRQLLERERQKAAEANRQIDKSLEANAIVNSTEYDYVPGQGQVIRQGTGRNNEATTEKAKQIEEKLTNAVERREKALERIARIEAEIARRNALPVGPEIPEYIRMQRDADIKEAQEAARKTDEATKKLDNIVEVRNRKAELDSLSEQIKSGGSIFQPIMEDLKRQSQEAWEKAQSSVGTDDFDKNLNEWNFIQEKIKTAQSAEKGRLGGLLSEYKDEESDTQSKMDSITSRASNYKLSDALTRVGGGSGYSAQVRGVYDSVSKIQKTLQTELTSIRDIITRISNNMDITTATYAE